MLVLRLADALLQRRWTLATAESCTGGMIAAACTDLAGSSQWFDRGLVTYSNKAKTDLLGVDAQLIARLGAVSEAVARAMASGARTRARSDAAVAVTGVAGPTGGSVEKPVGTVWFAWDVQGSVFSEIRQFDGDRAAVRQATLRHALERLLALVDSGSTPAAAKP
ncbi:MAG: CinA family protein [Burkholderiaceae bacterium]